MNLIYRKKLNIINPNILKEAVLSTEWNKAVNLYCITYINLYNQTQKTQKLCFCERNSPSDQQKSCKYTQFKISCKGFIYKLIHIS